MRRKDVYRKVRRALRARVYANGAVRSKGDCGGDLSGRRDEFRLAKLSVPGAAMPADGMVPGYFANRHFVYAAARRLGLIP
jgi:hypothetical protein